MPKTLLTVATRKGTFVLESDDRRDWTMRGPYCEGWPVYHSIYDPNTGSIFAAAASEWHGSAIWRSSDLGETWEHSSEGLAYDDEDGRRISKVSTLARAGDRLLVGVEAPGIFESRDDGKTWSLLSTLSGQHGSEGWDDPANQPPGHLGISGFVTEPDDSDSFFTIVQGVGAFETEDGGSSWTPRNKGLRRDWPADYEDVGFCVHKLVRAADPQRMYQQNHVGMHRSDDAGQSWNEITEGLPGDFGFAAAAHPHDRETFYVIPVDGGHGRVDARRQGGRLAHARRRLELAGHAEGPAAGERAPRRPAPGADHRQARRSGCLLRHEHRPGVRQRRRGRDVERDRQLPAVDLLRRRGGARLTWPTCGSRAPSPRSSPG